MVRITLQLVLLLTAFAMAGLGSHAKAQTQDSIQFWPDEPHHFHPNYISSPRFSLFPKYIQQNPMGYAPLCRMELKIEKQLPVGVWMRADGAAYRQAANPGLAYLRLKIPIGGQ